MPKLGDDEIALALRDLPDWRHVADGLHKEFTFRGFRAAIDFIDRVAEKAIAARHHPDIEIHYNRVTVSLSTHDEGGITEKDVALATEIESVVEPPQDA